ncbi:hypothetical protein [Mycobacterium haemophilum]|uniref:Serine/threonine protein kinase n=1 Tax=Mycobacterium haemophilum TaxID=29311 RepID=A0A0I9YVV2_9MYCO|nr:hypothetical protein [Mycobacterium haemophilum]AKN15341.1 serine/threonine protein kinase [Mycobacterium haemophilum DSM 44634]KLO33179.1 serine/threonine protein kinase [Mycobacterium haemophilum]KLO38135.1 serine/threonine protein kinase [Mycobacterium haemophilum]KLO44457.1 serine/threonine protein kinase [Mycobacterium haemophilum]KLO49531.1 serine/threonine protein kinase [Mycobacterium haemophilum]
MSHLTTTLRAATAAALMSSFACPGTGTATADPTSSDVNTLAGSLSKGYNSNNCSSQTPPSGVLAVLECGQNADPDGPVKARYLLFSNGSDMASSFTTSIGSDTLADCGDVKSPTVWHQGSSTDSAGQVACGTYHGSAEVIWTADAKNVLGVIDAADGNVPKIYAWWQKNG